MDSRRTVVVSGVPKVLPDSRMSDKLMIHFQSSRRSGGGDVEEVTYPTNMDGVAFVTFYKAEDAERVVRKEQHIMKDDQFPEDYSLTVFPFSRDVFLYVPSATVDLSVFGSDQASLIESLRSTHRSIRFRSSCERRGASVEGPLSAIKALREDLIHRAQRLKPSSQTAAVKPKVTGSNPRVMSYQESDGSVGFAGTKTKENPESSNCFLKLEQSRGEAGGVLISKPEERFRQVIGGESSAGTGSVSGLEPNSVVEKSAKRQTEHSFSQKSFVAKASGKTQWGSLKGPSSSTTNSRFAQTNLKKVSSPSASSSKDTEDIWVDLYTFKYIEKFHKKELNRLLKDVDVSTECDEGNDLVRISLTEKESSEASARRLKTASEDLKNLIEVQKKILRVHEIVYDKAVFLNKQTLTSICEEANVLHDEVLYTVEDSCIKAIGPSVFCQLFGLTVKTKMSKVRGFHVNSKDS